MSEELQYVESVFCQHAAAFITNSLHRVNKQIHMKAY